MNDSAEVAFIAPGSYGTGEVRIAGLDRVRPDLVVLLHGVHGCAELVPGNKYDNLARLLDKAGFDVMVVQTSRRHFDREAFGENRDAWARDAFGGKTYAMDFYDAVSGLAAVRERYQGRRFWLWGFSLGGIHWTMAAGGMAGEVLRPEGLTDPLGEVPDLEGIVLSGSGLRIAREENPIMDLPILDTLAPEEWLMKAAARVRVRHALAFYGSEDATFSEEACRRLHGLIPATGRKLFRVLPGVDHPFRHVDGVPGIVPLETMVADLTAMTANS